MQTNRPYQYSANFPHFILTDSAPISEREALKNSENVIILLFNYDLYEKILENFHLVANYHTVDIICNS